MEDHRDQAAYIPLIGKGIAMMATPSGSCGKGMPTTFATMSSWWRVMWLNFSGCCIADSGHHERQKFTPNHCAQIVPSVYGSMPL
jgi:hypothetical protein